MNHYVGLAAMTALMFVAMFVLMYAMVDKLDNVFPNLNQVYMAGLMTAPMVLIELALMWSMYKSRAADAAIAIVSVIAFAVFWLGIRQQIVIADEQFLKSMIPHHAGAILMCGQAPVQDEDVKSLCQNIIRSQQSETDQMKVILSRLDHS